MNKTKATCAACGVKKELCESCTLDGVKQPRICMECLAKGMNTGDYGVKELLWIKQLIELGERDSIEALRKKGNSYD